MPKLSDTMEEGGIATWLVKEGQSFEEGDPLLGIETDKATVEYMSPYAGTLLKILVPEGTSCKLRDPIAVYGSKGETFDLAQLMKEWEKSFGKKTSHEPEVKKETVSVAASVTQVETKTQTSTRTKASPLAKKIAKEQGLDLNSLLGTGPNGRIIARDLASAKTSVNLNRPTQQAGDVKIPHSMMRKTIAKRLLAAKNEAPHFYLGVSANMENMLSWREDLNKHKDVVAGKLAKVSVNDLLILTVSKALRLHPEVNSSWQEDCILQYGSVNVAFAVALPSGLITPVLFNSDTLGIREIARLSKELGEKAKKGTLKPEEYNGGTFSISNLGMTQVEAFTAIINPPQSCILAVGRTQRVPHVDDDGKLIVQHRMKMTLSCDHRVVDGMVGAKFLETLIKFLEAPLSMLA
jgi:pyruvate dehydrogenase E2 component (dihydrolipoamide acetyltransferase)